MLRVEPPCFVSNETRVQVNFQPDVTSLFVGWFWHKNLPSLLPPPEEDTFCSTTIRVRNKVPTRTYYTYITSSHLGVGAGRGLCSPNRSTSPPDQPIVRYGNHTHMVCPRTWPTNGKLSLAPTKRTFFHLLFDYNAFITIYVPQRFGEPQRVQWCVFAITPATDYDPLATTVFKFPLQGPRKFLMTGHLLNLLQHCGKISKMI